MVDMERAETYLRDLAESELRRFRDSTSETLPDATARVQAVATAFARTGALDPAVADVIVDDLTTAVEIRSYSGGHGRSELADLRRVHRIGPGGMSPGEVSQVSVTPAGELLELRGGETDMDVYLVAAIRTAALACLSAGILSLPKGSLPRRRKKRQGLPPQASRVLPGWSLRGIPDELRAVDDAGRCYDLVFNGGGDNTWSAGQFNLLPNPRAPQSPLLVSAAWLDIGNDDNSVRVDLTARFPAIAVTTTGNRLAPGEQLLRIRTEALFGSGYRDIGTGLPELAALVPALRTVGLLPEESITARLISALCHRYAVSAKDIAIGDPPAPLPARWAGLLTSRYDTWPESDSTRHPSPAAAHLPVTFPQTDGVTTVLSGLVTRGRRTTVVGAFFGAIDQGYPEGPCIWLRDDDGQWHVAKPGSWSSGGVNIFGANVVPPVPPSVTAVDVLVISRTADARASVPLTWWTS
jgi:hypothetical protein